MAPRWYAVWAIAPIATPSASSSHRACVSTATSSLSYTSRSRARREFHSAASTVETVQLRLRSREDGSPRSSAVESATLALRWWRCPAMVVRPGTGRPFESLAEHSRHQRHRDGGRRGGHAAIQSLNAGAEVLPREHTQG